MANIKNNNLYYGVDIDLHNVGVEIRVNDIPIYFDDSKGQLTVEIPAPETIINGTNTLSINAFLPIKTDKYEEGAYVVATLFQQDLSPNGANKVKLASAKISLNNTEANTLTQDYITEKTTSDTIQLSQEKSTSLEVNTQINSLFPRWAWQDGQTIESTSDNKESLMQAYQKIHDALASKDVGLLKELYKQRSQEVAIAYNLDNIEAGHQKLSVGKDLLNDELELRDIFFKNMSLHVLANGKLARISTPRNTQPIYYLQENPRLLHLYKFMFYLNNKNEWVMIR